MAQHRPISLTDHGSPPFKPHTPDPRYEARFSHSTASTRLQHAISDIIFGGAKVKTSVKEEQVRIRQQSDYEHLSKMKTLVNTISIDHLSEVNTDTSGKPSEEVGHTDQVNSNGFDDDSSGWPGFGTCPGYSMQGSSQTRRFSHTKPLGNENRAIAK